MKTTHATVLLVACAALALSAGCSAAVDSADEPSDVSATPAARPNTDKASTEKPGETQQGQVWGYPGAAGYSFGTPFGYGTGYGYSTGISCQSGYYSVNGWGTGGGYCVPY